MSVEVTWKEVIAMAEAAGIKPHHKVARIVGHLDFPTATGYKCQVYPTTDAGPLAYLPKTIQFVQKRSSEL